ncbi:acetylcholine receptor subunit beta-like 2 [Andrena cerasifolii]|uniref:acetylcholine receptor subunit beta-like 2 n=1 Tax=Andrena cerasifolii TaxID=2819439 RepID=UPI004037E8A8
MWALGVLFYTLSIVYGAAGKTLEANPDTMRLYDDLPANYNRLIRLVINNTETLTVLLGLKLSQLIEMNLKNQVMTTNVWVERVKYIPMHPVG